MLLRLSHRAKSVVWSLLGNWIRRLTRWYSCCCGMAPNLLWCQDCCSTKEWAQRSAAIFGSKSTRLHRHRGSGGQGMGCKSSETNAGRIGGQTDLADGPIPVGTP